MLPFEDRYSRQRRLPEVGPHGQRRLATLTLLLAEHEGAVVERDYLLRSGVADARCSESGERLDFPFGDWFEFAAPRALANGAWCALHRIRRALSEPLRT